MLSSSAGIGRIISQGASRPGGSADPVLGPDADLEAALGVGRAAEHALRVEVEGQAAVGGGLLVIGFIDLLYKRWKHTKDLMMTKQDVKDEAKQADGNPEVKGKIREIQRKNAMARMKAEVEDASVVVRNPTHYAVALKYSDGDVAPRVVAKGRALMALTIIRIAEEAGVEVIVNKPLAREMYRTVKVGDWRDAIGGTLYSGTSEIQRNIIASLLGL